jgi:TetR/AcrR family transcriptional regulator
VTLYDSTQPLRGPRERILDAASAVFAEHGFAGARVDEIAARARVNKAMLYYHVGDKKALYTAVLLRNFDRVSEALSEALAAGGTAACRLEAVIAAITRVVQTYPDHPRIVLREFASGAVTLPDDVLTRMLEVVGVVRAVLADGVRAGELRETEPVLTHLAVLGAVVFLNVVTPIRERAAALAVGGPVPGPEVDLAHFVSDLLLYGIAAPARGGGSR